MEQLEKIIRYLDGEVVGEERQLLEKEIESDSSLQQTLRLIQDVNQTLADEDLMNFVNQLRDVQTETNQSVASERKKKKVIIWRALAAACIVTVLTISAVIYFGNLHPSNDKIFATFYHRYEAELLTRSGEPSDVSELIKAIQLYDKGDYPEAIQKFESIIKSDASNTAARFFIGASYVELKNYTKAIDNFNYVITRNDTAFVEHAEWYLSLCYLKTNQTAKANALLHKIANGATFYKVMASEVLSKMK
jgi:Uncharacterized protein conserved in bacteria